MNGSPEIYRASEAAGDSLLRQGEIVSNLAQIRIRIVSLDTDQPLLDQTLHGFAIVLTQDCDLTQDFSARQGENKPDKLIRTRIRQDKDERYHFLQRVEPSQDALNQGLPETGIDFKRYFTLPTDEVYFRISGDAKRRCRLISPYLEHFSSRFSYYLSRIALPEDHFSEPR